MTRDPKIRMKRSVIHREPETDSARTAETAENLTRTGSMPDGSIDPLLQFIDGAGTAALGCVCLHHSFGRGLAWCPWCPLTSEFGSTGLKRAMQAKRLNVRKATKHAGFQ
jgi:hypothetical protein